MRAPLVALALAVWLHGVASADPLTDPSPPEVYFSQAIQDKAVELDHDPVRIYEFVRNDLDYEVYWGLMKGPEGALLSGGGNDYDLSALLVSLLRTSGYRARFVRGRVSLPSLDAVGITGAAEAVAPGNELDAGLGAQQYWAAVEPDEWHVAALGGDLSRGAAWDGTTHRVSR